MSNRTLAHVIDGAVRELFTVPPAFSDLGPDAIFPPGSGWVECDRDGVAVGWTRDDDGAWAPPVVAGPTVESALKALERRHAQAEESGFRFQASGAEHPSAFGSGPASQGKLVSAFVMSGAGLWVDGTPWVSVDGVGVPMTSADVQQLAARIAGYVAACTTRYAEAAVAVRADPTTNISGGWPTNQ